MRSARDGHRRERSRARFLAGASVLVSLASFPGWLSAAEGPDTRILLNAGVVDTSTPQAQARRAAALPSTGKAMRLVQFSGPIQPAWYAALEATGVRVVTYIPENAYLVWGTGAQLAAVARLADVRWEGAYTPFDRIDPGTKAPTGAYSVQLVEDADENPATVALVHALAKKPALADRLLGYVNLRVFAGTEAVSQLAARADVVSIQNWIEPEQRDERQDMIVAGNLTGGSPSGAGYLAWLASKGFTQAQFTASGFGVDVSDSGVDDGTPQPNHFGLYVAGDVTGTSRVVYNRLEGTPNVGSTIAGCDGHGNLNAHIIGGYSDLTGAPFQDAAGFRYGLGVAPFVKLGSSVVFDPGYTNPVYEDLQSRAYRDAMRVSSNSWSASTAAYTTDSQRYDALVRDAQPTGSAVPNAGNQEMVIVFAAGNGGPAARSVGSPGTAKNVLTAGASENVHAFGAPDRCSIPDSEADSALDVAPFSSRGPCSDGRKKPDLMAPGTHVSGGVAQASGQQASPPAVAAGQALACFDASRICAGPGTSTFWPLGQQWYTASSGTSHSTPAIAGGAALLRQYFINQGMTPPSPAMTKAYLMNSARYMNGTGGNDTLYSNNQGMGLMDLGRAFDGTGRLLDDENPANLFTATGQTRTFNGFASNPAKPFRVTLAWTDAPGSTTGSAWNNDLDLTVTVGGNTYKGNVFAGGSSVTGGTADAANNVESVFLPAGVTGAFTVTVTAANVNSDGVPGNASPLDQDFALVVYNGCATQPAAPAGVSAAATAPNQVTVSFTTNGSTEYRVYRSQVSGGPYTFVGTTAVSPYVDNGISGGLTVYYVVRAVNCAESANSNEASVSTTGTCTLPPTFAGLTSATNGAASTCTNSLAWSAATPACAGTITYNVYRDLSAGFAPGPANRIAAGLTGTSFSDDLNLASGTTYFYVVRAVETADVVVEETNTVEKSAMVTGTVTPGVYRDDFDANRPADPLPYWIPTTITGTAGTMNITTGCRWQSSDKAYRFGAATAACGGTYPTSTDAMLVLGGNGTTPGIDGFWIPPAASMTFRLWYDFESGFDGAWLTYSTTGAGGPWINVGDAVVAGAPYISAGGYDDALRTDTSVRIWTGTNAGVNGSLKAVTVNLGGVASTKVWFAFRFHSDSSVVREGMYVDDVQLDKFDFASCSTNVPPPGPAVRYSVTVPSPVAAGTPVTATVTALDAFDQVATGYAGSSTLTSSDPLAAFTSPVSFTAGVASPPVTFFTAGTRSLTATDTVTSSVTGTGSTTVTSGAPAALAFTVQPSNVVAGAGIVPAVQVAVLDLYGNPTSSTASVTLALGANPGGGTLAGTLTAAAVAGVATFPGLSVDKVGTGYTLTAASAGLNGATSAAFDVTHGAPSKLVFTQGPSTTAAGQVIRPALTVAVRDVFDNLCTTSTAPVTLVLLSNPTGASLGGTVVVNAVAGIATFSDVTVSTAGVGYALLATSSGLATAVSVGFDVTAACTTPPLFAGLATAAAAGTPTCSNTLAWAAATPSCTGSITYSVYRSLTAGLAPSVVNRIATGVSGTSYVDSVNLVGGTPYYYVVRAVETTSAGPIEDSNTVERSATPTTPCTTDHAPAGEAVAYVLTGLPAGIWAGTPAHVTITAYDSNGEVATGYQGVAGYSSSDPSAAYLGAIAFHDGVGTATVTFATLGSHTFTVTDVVKPSLTVTGTTFVRAAGAMVFYPLTPCRVVDTRGEAGTFGWPPIGAAGGPDRTFPLVSAGCGIPSSARAVSLNVTVVNAGVAGDLLVYPADTDPGAASTLAFAAARTRACMDVVGVSADGTGSVRVRNHAAAQLDLVIDVNGYFAP